MHNNFFFLRQLSAAVGARLKDCVVSECFSQNRDELVIRFETHTEPFFIKASLLSTFSCLSFPREFHRARKNSVDLFAGLIGHRVAGYTQYENERSFSLLFDGDVTLLFKLHGNRANILLFVDGRIDELFKNSITDDESIVLANLNRTIDWRYENFTQHQHDLAATYFTFGKEVWAYLDQQQFNTTASLAERWTIFQHVVQGLQQPAAYYIVDHGGKLAFSLFPSGTVVKTFDDPIAAVNAFFLAYSQQAALVQERSGLLGSLQAKLKASESYIQKTEEKLRETEGDNNYKSWADLLMANLHAIPPNADKVTLPNFYNDNHPIEIRLKAALSPQKNAEVFYKKSKKQQLEVDRLRGLINAKRADNEKLRQQVAAAQATTDLKTLRPLTASFGVDLDKEKQTRPLPYHEVQHNGYRIWIGRNAERNDELTLRYGYKDDLWLHAKDVPGSHVLVKHQAGKNFPKDVIERAAQLAAWHSKRKTDTLCPVVVVPKKFVRKRKGDPPGAVVLDRETVILVEPKA